MESINEVVGLLAKLAPERLDALRATYPAQRSLFQEGIIAGDQDPLGAESLPSRPTGSPPAPASDPLRARAAALVQAMEVIVAAAAQRRADTRKVLVSAGRWELGSQAATLLGSSGLFTLIVTHAGESPQLATAAATTVAAVATFATQYLRRAPPGATGTLVDHYHELATLSANAEDARDELTYLDAGIPDERLRDLIKKGNVVSRTARDLL